MKNHLLLILMSLVLVAPAFAIEESLTLEKLQQDKDYESGCGCSVINSKDEVLVFSDLQEKALAIVRIHGLRKELKFVSSTAKSRLPKIGDAFERVYSAGNTKLRLKYKTTFVCEKDDESCEVTRYSVDATLEDGSSKAELKNLKGDCGC